MKEISDLRGAVITYAVDIEAYIGWIISIYFASSHKQYEFSTLVLSDPYFSFGLKISVLKKMLNQINWNPYKDFKKDLHRIEALRNRFAHSMVYGIDGELMYTEGEKPLKVKKAKEMYDEFFTLRPKVFEELKDVLLFLVKGIRKE